MPELARATQRYIAEFSVWSYQSSIRFEHRARALLDAEGVRAGRAYSDTGKESAALDQVEASIYLDYLTRLHLTIVPGAAKLTAEALPGKAAEDVFVRAALRWLRLHAG